MHRINEKCKNKQFLVVNLKGPVGSSKHTWEDNIKMALMKGIGPEDEKWILVAQ
jgi:hypothetical protein